MNEMITPFRIKRVYETCHLDDGTRVLVDRLWPRGVTKSRAHIDLWLKDIAPSPALREWFGHDPARWNEFRRRYGEELRELSALVVRMEDLAMLGRVTLIYAARDTAHNHARVLADYLGQHWGASRVAPAA
jgi:uncharacterized protein YeaO (DUF488 family)